MVNPGQVWQNGKVAVKVQGSDSSLELVTFDMEPKTEVLKFRESKNFVQNDALDYLSDLGCRLTDKVLIIE